LIRIQIIKYKKMHINIWTLKKKIEYSVKNYSSIYWKKYILARYIVNYTNHEKQMNKNHELQINRTSNLPSNLRTKTSRSYLNDYMTRYAISKIERV
jgi:hypothetical protein